jgi:hypothetical protein
MDSDFTTVLRAAGERGLPSLLIGGNAVILYGFLRTTADLDLLVPAADRARWLELMRELGYRFFHGVPAFAQFEAPDQTGPPLDLMFVEPETWTKMCQDAREMDLAGQRVLLPKPEYLVALKLHAAASPARHRTEVDWEDIRQIVKHCNLSANDDVFRQIILRYGGPVALARIEAFTHGA